MGRAQEERRPWRRDVGRGLRWLVVTTLVGGASFAVACGDDAETPAPAVDAGVEAGNPCRDPKPRCVRACAVAEPSEREPICVGTAWHCPAGSTRADQCREAGAVCRDLPPECCRSDQTFVSYARCVGENVYECGTDQVERPRGTCASPVADASADGPAEAQAPDGGNDAGGGDGGGEAGSGVDGGEAGADDDGGLDGATD